MSTIIYRTRIIPLCDDSLFRKFYSQMPASRKAKIDALAFRSDKMLSLGAGLLLSHALSCLGIPVIPEITVTEAGKPYFKDRPDLGFSISHSGDTVICAVADHDVGADIEKIGRADLSIARRFFTGEENDIIAAEPDEPSKKIMFYRLWTLKESFLKITGLGLSLPLNDFSVSPGIDRISVRQSFDNRNYFFREFDDLHDYRISCCSVRDDFRGICDISLENAFPD